MGSISPKRPFKSVKELLSLVIGVVIKPVETFGKIAKGKATKETFIEAPTVCIISSLCYAVTKIGYSGVEHGGRISSEIIGKIIALVLLAGLDNLSAKLLKAKGNYTGLLTSYFLASSVWIISLPVLLVFNFLKFGFARTLLFICIIVWGFVLEVIAIKETYEFTLLKSVFTRILAILFLVTFFALLVIVVK